MNESLRSKFQSIRNGLIEILAGFARFNIVSLLALNDIKARYRRSRVGTFWITISLAAVIVTIGSILGSVFQDQADNYLIHLTVGIILWSLISTTLNEACICFIEASAIIRQLNLPLIVFVLRVVWRNILVFLHNIVLVPIGLLFFGDLLSVNLIQLLFGSVLVVFNLTWMSIVCGFLATRYRDVSNIVSSILQVLFYMTPIIWSKSQLDPQFGLGVLLANPFFHLVDVIRAPIMGYGMSSISVLYTLVFGIFGWLVALIVYDFGRRRLVYWL